MAQESALGKLSRLSSATSGVFCGGAAVQLGVTRNQLGRLLHSGAITRELPDTYRMTAVRRTSEQRLRAALLWAGPGAAAAGRSAGELYGLEGIRAARPEIAIARSNRSRSPHVLL